MPRDAISVFVVAETRLYREGLAKALDGRTDIMVVGGAADPGAAALGIADLPRPPEVALVDDGIPEGAGAIRILREAAPSVCVVAVAIGEAAEDVLPWAEAGASGFVPREASLDDLITSVRSVADGAGACTPRIAAALLNRVAATAGPRRAGASLRELTGREREVALLLEEGLSNKEIASRLSIELPTVKNHVHHVLEKLSVRRRGEAASLVRTDHAGN